VLHALPCRGVICWPGLVEAVPNHCPIIGNAAIRHREGSKLLPALIFTAKVHVIMLLFSF
jgi:hypothetical protein